MTEVNTDTPATPQRSKTPRAAEERKSLTGQAGRIVKKRGPPTEMDAIRLARKCNLQFHEIRECLREFLKLDEDRSGFLNREQFLVAVSERLGTGKGAADEDKEAQKATLSEIWMKTDRDGTGSVDFEEFVAWTQTTAFNEDMVVSCETDKELRKLAKENCIPLPDVESIFKEFGKFDEDKSGQIEKAEFQDLVCTLMRTKDRTNIPQKRLDALWKDADTDGGGSLNFAEFLLWYKKNFSANKGSEGEGSSCLVSQMYRKLGIERMTSFYNSLKAKRKSETEGGEDGPPDAPE